MESRTIHDKIPDNVRVNKAAADDAMLRAMYKRAARKTKDAVTPTVKGLRGVTPSVKGIAANARYADVAKRTLAVASGLDAILKIRDSAEAEEYPELAAMVNNPKLLKAIGLMIEKLSAEVRAMLLEDQIANATGKPSGSADSATLPRKSVSFDSKVKAATAFGALNPVRVAMGLGDQVATADDLYAMFGCGEKRYV